MPSELILTGLKSSFRETLDTLPTLGLVDTLGSMTSNENKAKLTGVNTMKVKPGAGKDVEVKFGDGEGKAIVATSDSISGKDNEAELDFVHAVGVKDGEGKGLGVNAKDRKNDDLEDNTKDGTNDGVEDNAKDGKNDGVEDEDDKDDDEGAVGESDSSEDEDYEMIRQKNIARRHAMMASLLPQAMKTSSVKVAPREKMALPTEPAAPRKSDRIAAKQAKALQVLTEASDDSGDDEAIESGARKRKLSEDEESPQQTLSSPQQTISTTRNIHTRASAKQMELERLAAPLLDNPVNKDNMTTDANEILYFSDYPDFTPNLTPADMIREGVFGGAFWRPIYSERLGRVVKGDWKELPLEWLEGVDIERYLLQPEPDPSVNKMGVLVGATFEQQKARGWIRADLLDCRGWFQWYCRFYEGRRCVDDQGQIGRWLGFLGPRGRYRMMLLHYCVKKGIRRLVDAPDFGPVFAQWAYQFAWEIHQADLDEAWLGH